MDLSTRHTHYESVILSKHRLLREFWSSLGDEKSRWSSLRQPQWTNWCQKDELCAYRWRYLGTEAFRAENYEAAVDAYTRGIAAAPTDSAELELTYGQRGTALMALDKFDHGLLDTNRALMMPFESQLVKERRGQMKEICWNVMEKFNKNEHKLQV